MARGAELRSHQQLGAARLKARGAVPLLQLVEFMSAGSRLGTAHRIADTARTMVEIDDRPYPGSRQGDPAHYARGREQRTGAQTEKPNAASISAKNGEFDFHFSPPNQLNSGFLYQSCASLRIEAYCTPMLQLIVFKLQ
jgi:hypothetical protein